MKELELEDDDELDGACFDDLEADNLPIVRKRPWNVWSSKVPRVFQMADGQDAVSGWWWQGTDCATLGWANDVR